VQPADSFAPTIDYDSDNSQVKKKTKVSALEWQGQTFYITGKESALHILRDTFSVRSLMEDGQLQLLVHHVGDFVNNYTADVFKAGILRRNAKSAVLAGMTLTMNANHDLDRFQSLACFDIKEMQDNVYFQKYSFPDAQTTFSLCAEHYLTKSDAIACGFQIVSHDFWIRSWKGYRLIGRRSINMRAHFIRPRGTSLFRASRGKQLVRQLQRGQHLLRLPKLHRLQRISQLQ